MYLIYMWSWHNWQQRQRRENELRVSECIVFGYFLSTFCWHYFVFVLTIVICHISKYLNANSLFIKNLQVLCRIWEPKMDNVEHGEVEFNYTILTSWCNVILIWELLRVNYQWFNRTYLQMPIRCVYQNF